MKTFSDVLRDMEKNLGREMQDREIDFLHWVFDRYQEEQQKEKKHAIN